MFDASIEYILESGHLSLRALAAVSEELASIPRTQRGTSMVPIAQTLEDRWPFWSSQVHASM